MRTVLALVLALTVQQAPRDTSAAAPPPVERGTSAIKGRVVTADTAVPIRGALVTVSGPGVPPRNLYTDAEGRYEARNLPAGSYRVSARPSVRQARFLSPPPAPTPVPAVTLAAGQTIEWYDLTLVRAGAIVGRVVDENGDPVGGVSIAAQRAGESQAMSGFPAQISDELGRYRVFRLPAGDYEIQARPGGLSDYLTGGATTVGYVDTYYPSTLSRQEAVRVAVRAGHESAIGDLQLISARLLRVRGTVVTSGAGLNPTGTLVGIYRERGGTGSSVDTSGRFSFLPQPPGTYRVIARLPSENRETTVAYGSVPITLVDEDIDDLVVTMKPTVTIAGRLVFEGHASPPIPGGRLSIRVDAAQRTPYSQLTFSMARVEDDLTFTLRNLATELLLRPSGEIDGTWSLKSVLLGGTDITDVPREFQPEDSGRIQVVLTDRWAEVAGLVTDAKGAPAPNSVIVLFGDDRSAWFTESSRLRAAYATREGRFALRGVRPGRYHLVALPPGTRWDFQQIDKALLEKYALEATAIALGEDDRRQIDLKVTIR